MKGKIYYLEFNSKGEYEKDPPYLIKDINNRLTPFTKEDIVKNSNKYFLCSYNGNFARIINMTIIKGLIFNPCPWKDTYKDQSLYCYFDEDAYNYDLSKEKNKQFNYDTIITGRDVFDFIECFRFVNEEMASEIGLIVELTKDDGRW